VIDLLRSTGVPTHADEVNFERSIRSNSDGNRAYVDGLQ
jgi:hypothetical protein